MQALLHVILAASAVAGCALAFVWPFAVSSDPADPIYRMLAIGAFAGFLGSLAALAATRLLRGH